jgi:hypothetical protein
LTLLYLLIEILGTALLATLGIMSGVSPKDDDDLYRGHHLHGRDGGSDRVSRGPAPARSRQGWLVAVGLYYAAPLTVMTKPAFWQSELIYPAIGLTLSIWASVELGFRRGKAVADAYAPNPLAQSTRQAASN